MMVWRGLILQDQEKLFCQIFRNNQGHLETRNISFQYRQFE